jgi:pimeloyl-ACP methyl ester carboxylesterase
MMLPKLVLLPGMHGTGTLFRDLVAALPAEIETKMVDYPPDVLLSEAELAGFVRSVMPDSGPTVLLAESFSTPLAIQYAATHPPNLRGLAICVGFASRPVPGWMRFAGWMLAPSLTRLALPDFAIRRYLAGMDAPACLLSAVKAAVSSVKPAVMSARLRFVLACDMRVELGRIAVPMLLIQAAQDRLVSRSCGEEILRIRPEMAVRVIDGPHLILQREPEKAGEIVAEFVRQIA